VKSRKLDKDVSRMRDSRNRLNILEAFAWKTWKQIEGEYKIDLSRIYWEMYGTVSESCPVTSFDTSGFEISGPSTRRLIVTRVKLFTVGTNIFVDTELLLVQLCIQF
jgi:hypothetical protein